MALLRCALAIGIVIALSTPVRPAHAQASVIVTGGGLGTACFEMATAVSLGKTPALDIEVTGSHVRLDALDVCTMAIDKSELSTHDRAATHNNRGAVYFARSLFKQAAADSRHALRLDPTIAEAHANLGGALVGLKQWKEAMAELNKGIEMEGSHLEYAYYNRAIVHEEMNDLRGAYFDFLKASELSPEWDLPRQYLAQFSVRKKDDPAS